MNYHITFEIYPLVIFFKFSDEKRYDIFLKRVYIIPCANLGFDSMKLTENTQLRCR